MGRNQTKKHGWVPPTEDPGDRLFSVQLHTFAEMPHNNVPAYAHHTHPHAG